jgi:hypothetical protein
MPSTTKKTAKPRFLSRTRLLALCRRFGRAKLLSGRYERQWKAAQAEILDDLAARGVADLQLGDTRIARAQQKPTVVVDGERLWEDLTPEQRPLAFDVWLDLNHLPPEVRERIQAALPDEVKASIEVRDLDPVGLKAAVAAGRIDAQVVERHTTTEKEKAPYVVITNPPAQ